MPETAKVVPIAFLAIITGLFAGIVVPEFFNGLVNTGENRQLYQSIRIFVVIFVVFIIGGIIAVYTKGD